MSMDDFVEDLIAVLEENDSLSKEDIAKRKVELCRKHAMKKIPTDIEVFLHAPDDVSSWLRTRLQTKPNRSLSGVAPIAIMTSPHSCPHGKCTMCPGGVDGEWGDTPQSYTGAEPAAMRGARAGFDPYFQVFNRLEQYAVTGHILSKVDLIIMGGTFPARDKSYQDEFVMYAFKAMNDFSDRFFDDAGEFLLEEFKRFFELPGDIYDADRETRIRSRLEELKCSSSLETEQVRNESSFIRCIGLTIETRPDWGLEEHGDLMLEQGCTRVELGIQSVYDDALSAIDRGHDIACNKQSIAVLRDLGFKLNFHMMLGLPGVDEKREKQGLAQLFEDSSYQPDMLKLYPCMVMPGTKLLHDFEAGRYTPFSTERAAAVIGWFLSKVPAYCRVMRVQRDIPTYRRAAGVDRTNLRQYVDRFMDEHDLKSRDIRAREVGRKSAGPHPANASLEVIEYEASAGKEFFISFEDTDADALYGFCRLRFPSRQLRAEFTPSTAIIRELHVYGSAARLGAADGSSFQHKGFGRKLLARAERIALEHGYDKMLVISGVGVRGYYRKFGYDREGPYMAKKLA
ncbi:MAG: tRNA uridine(34) 5-carboxymethylaminomethyl modification radical SAM/GNAT enzyme Elp3 [Candidatus Woesearchaeota archaeon]